MIRKRKPKPQFRNINVRLSVEQYNAIEETAYDLGKFKAEFLRELGLKAAKRAGNL